MFDKNYKGWFPIISDYDNFRLTGLTGDSKLISLEWLGYMKNMLIRDTNIMSMANSLEVRHHLLIGNCFHIFCSYRIQLRDQLKIKKQLLVESCSDWVLPEIVESTKMGFVFPMREWLFLPLNSIVKKNIETLGNYQQTSNLKKTALENLKQLEANKTTWSRVWQWVVLGKFLEDRSI